MLQPSQVYCTSTKNNELHLIICEKNGMPHTINSVHTAGVCSKHNSDLKSAFYSAAAAPCTAITVISSVTATSFSPQKQRDSRFCQQGEVISHHFSSLVRWSLKEENTTYETHMTWHHGDQENKVVQHSFYSTKLFHGVSQALKNLLQRAMKESRY